MPGRHEHIRLQNIRIAVAARRHHFDSSVGVPFLCECDDTICHEFVVASLSQYERIRKERLVLVAARHRVTDGALVCEGEEHDVYRVAAPQSATA